MRICSLLPGATEVVAALGLADHLVGISHECDYPPGLTAPVMVEPVILSDGLSSEEIDRQVRAASAEAHSLYRLREAALAQARPDLIIVQDLCDVCAITPAYLDRVVLGLTPSPSVLKLHPQTLADCMADIERIGAAVGRDREAHRLAEQLRRELDDIHRQVSRAAAARPRVACLEWLSPLYIAGHWVPDMVQQAGGTALLSESGTPSRRITWNELLAARPDTLVIMPCGFTQERAAQEFQAVAGERQWKDLVDSVDGRVHIVDALSYFSRPGPRLLDGVAHLASLLHPSLEVRTASRLPLSSIATNPKSFST